MERYEVPFEIIGKTPVLQPYEDELSGKRLYPLNPATVVGKDDTYLFTRWISKGQTFDPTERVSVYTTSWDFEEIEHKHDIEKPEWEDCNIVNRIEDIRAGPPDGSGLVDFGSNVVCCRENGEEYPVPIMWSMEPPYDRIKNPTIYNNFIGKNVLPLESNIDKNNYVFRLDAFNPSLKSVELRYVQDGGEGLYFREESIVERPEWGHDKIGLTGVPFNLYDSSQLYILHGFHISDGIYKYSIGTAIRYSGNWSINKYPLLTPGRMREKLKDITEWECEELRAGKKEVIYSDGVIPKGSGVDNEKRFDVEYIEDIISLINLGDYAIYAVKFNMEDILDSSKYLID